VAKSTQASVDLQMFIVVTSTMTTAALTMQEQADSQCIHF